MTFPGRDMRQGTFTAGTLGSSGTIPTTVTVNCGFLPTRVELINMSALGAMTGGPPVLNVGTNYLTYRAVWQEQFASAATPFTLIEGMAPNNAVAGVPVMSNSIITSNGIAQYDGHAASPQQFALGAKITGTSITKASGTFLVPSTAGIVPGATVLITSPTVDKQLGGMFFTVNTVTANTSFTIANASWLNTASFTGGAQTFSVQVVTTPSLYYPGNAQIVNISAANPAVITTSTNMNLTVGQQVRLYVPSAFKMTQANFQTAIVSAVSGNQITLGGLISLNSSAFTAFAWPTASQVPYTPAIVVPIGSGPTATTTPVVYNQDLLDDATTNAAYQGFTVGQGILNTASSTVFGVTAGDVFAWTAWRADQ